MDGAKKTPSQLPTSLKVKFELTSCSPANYLKGISKNQDLMAYRGATRP
jgi:hypothetical protein